MLADEMRFARYWASDARRLMLLGAMPEDIGQSLRLMATEREIARGWRAEVKRLEGLLAA